MIPSVGRNGPSCPSEFERSRKRGGYALTAQWVKIARGCASSEVVAEFAKIRFSNRAAGFLRIQLRSKFLLAEIVRLVARFPLDVASNARQLLVARLFAG